MFGIRQKAPAACSNRDPAFAYLPANAHYFDSACQTLRPQCVVDAERSYYLERNACGGRVKYRWGASVDHDVQAARTLLLSMAGKNSKDFTVAFTLNTSYGINLVLQQLKKGSFNRIVTSDIEHNSVLLPAQTWATRNGAETIVLERSDDGSLPYTPDVLRRSIVLLNTVSNIDGRKLHNLPAIVKDAHAGGGIVMLDAAQAFAHDAQALAAVDFDVIFGSGHKMYGPSIGFIIIRRSLLTELDPFFIGGGTVSDVTRDTFTLLGGDEDYASLEVGLQNWAGIIGLKAAIEWLQEVRPGGKEPSAYEAELAERLWKGIGSVPGLLTINREASSIVSVWFENLDSHRLALYLDEAGIMCRSGHFCCHAYLQHQRKLPPLLRMSLGLHNTPEDIDHLIETLTRISTTL